VILFHVDLTCSKFLMFHGQYLQHVYSRYQLTRESIQELSTDETIAGESETLDEETESNLLRRQFQDRDSQKLGSPTSS
jgi:hypothetical protein